jgi:hypothetical protein
MSERLLWSVGRRMALCLNFPPFTGDLYGLVDDQLISKPDQNGPLGRPVDLFRVTACASPAWPEFISSAAGQHGQAGVGDGGWVSRPAHGR